MSSSLQTLARGVRVSRALSQARPLTVGAVQTRRMTTADPAPTQAVGEIVRDDIMDKIWQSSASSASASSAPASGSQAPPAQPSQQ